MLNLSKVIGHRGAAAYAPENTLASFQKAQQCGASWVEFDVMQTLDGEIIVFHDDTLNRTTNGRGMVRQTNYADIETLDAGSWFASQFKGEKVPRFIDVIACLTDLQLHANVEIKAAPGTERALTEALLNLITQYWPTASAPLISSFNHASLRMIRESNSDLPLGLLLATWQPDWHQLADEFNCSTIHCNYRQLTQKRIRAIKDTGRLVLAYTVNTRALASKLFQLGVDAVFSDYPDLNL